ncbi:MULTISPECIES: hypothetical protein [Vibrio]|uniref:Lipoprotein n=1 Tax=Vibrio atlanticus TaxID=693153 RepID=A0ABV4KTI3_9VIBR|nr:hypothetical protein [Vibrio splendidus]KPL96814.1 hypothetical protein AN167_25690 [Vibrio splendidus]PMM09780.1 hypothetical protein BCT62_12510 [Vibrio splendidus]PMN26199.1 hypothetical protein BCT41_18905 [Vibrio splendidus]PMN29533.1 hypothetical protein BCT36_06900 [Vibrio splendidus]
MCVNLKNIIYLTLFSLALSGCSVAYPENETVVNTFEENFEFTAVNKQKAMEKSLEFVDKINRKHPKSTYVIEYNTDESLFIDEFVIKIKHLGIHKLRFNLNAISEGKDISIVAKYHVVEGGDCGSISFGNIDNYSFGCSLEYNRRLSLTTPALGKE